ncbi:MAG: hypothetical protein IT337_13205 [Thermomicrobiales bacterium]|nr:hypothetical protein [Thermomicrobiales bacterium]
MSDAVQIVEQRGANGLGLFFRYGSDERLYRIAPLRDPGQPRFWRLAVFACTASGLCRLDEPLWASARQLTRDEVNATLGTIRDDATEWLAGEPRADLRAYLRVARAPLVAVAAASAVTMERGDRAG